MADDANAHMIMRCTVRPQLFKDYSALRMAAPQMQLLNFLRFFYYFSQSRCYREAMETYLET
jgi:hypothetical protein